MLLLVVELGLLSQCKAEVGSLRDSRSATDV